MSTLIIGFIVAGVLLIAEYLLCTKFRSPLWGGIIPLLILAFCPKCKTETLINIATSRKKNLSKLLLKG